MLTVWEDDDVPGVDDLADEGEETSEDGDAEMGDGDWLNLTDDGVV
jgi:hypothetical protein